MTSGANLRKLGVMLISVLVLGVSVGLGAGLLSVLLIEIERYALGFMESGQAAGPYSVAPLRRVLSVFAGACFAAVVWWLLRTKAQAVPSVSKAVDGERMPGWQTLVHVVLQILIVGTGSSIGREVAPRELGALLGQRFASVLQLDETTRRKIVAVAAGAGLAGVYNAPFAGLFFAVEILLADISIETVAIALGTSAVAAYTAQTIKGHQVFYDLQGIQTNVTPSLLLFAVICGLCSACAGALFRKASQWAGSKRPQGSGIVWMMPVAALLTGIIAIWLPQIMGNGRAAAQLAFDTSSGSLQVLAILVATFVAKAFVTLATIRAGASGGVLQPGISLGALLGAILGLGWVALFPTDTITACALIGAAALLAASQQAPLMAMCLVVELTATPMAFLVPVGISVAISALVSAWITQFLSRTQRKRPLSVG